MNLFKLIFQALWCLGSAPYKSATYQNNKFSEKSQWHMSVLRSKVLDKLWIKNISPMKRDFKNIGKVLDTYFLNLSSVQYPVGKEFSGETSSASLLLQKQLEKLNAVSQADQLLNRNVKWPNVHSIIGKRGTGKK